MIPVLGGERVSHQAVQYSWTVGVAASPKATLDFVPAWLTDCREYLPRINVPVLITHRDADPTLPMLSLSQSFRRRAACSWSRAPRMG
ncbi:pimeloyl-ACP methyl ester carboxylesterase [Streptacidiphilus sp. MAP12-16]|uniref:hypothetical protein n=1 Tax=Streptacidiphilus sp. MAP12-16 TaxID=3156300 RepID=UPI0035144FF9